MLSKSIFNFEAAPDFLPFVRNIVLARYNLAILYSKNKKVIDIGCGWGLGSFILAKTAKKVLAVDTNSYFVNLAKKRYRLKNLDFENISYLNIPETNPVELVTAFEVVEHVKDENKFFRKINKILLPNGIFIFSTPNKVFSDHFLEGNLTSPYHVKEFYLDDLKILLYKNGFGIKKVVYSRFFNRSYFVIDLLRSFTKLGLRYVEKYDKKWTPSQMLVIAQKQ